MKKKRKKQADRKQTDRKQDNGCGQDKKREETG